MSTYIDAFPVVLDDEFFHNSTPAATVRTHRETGARNPCPVCKCDVFKHRIRRGEVVCVDHSQSCSKKLGSMMTRVQQKRKEKTNAKDVG